MKYSEKELKEIYEKITSNFDRVYDVINEFERVKVSSLKRPIRPIKPILKNSLDIDEVENYAELLKKYNQDLVNYENEYKIWMIKCNQIDDFMVKYIKEKSGLFDIPEKYQDKVFSLAYEYGHSNGYDSVYGYLVDLVEIFKN